MAITRADFATTVAAARRELAGYAEARMSDAVRVERQGEHVTDDDGFVTTPLVTVYDGPGKWQGPSGWSRSQVGESDMATGGLELHLPFDASAGVRVGDVVECTASVDTALVGRRFGVVDEFMKTAATSRRFRVEVVGR